MKKTRTAAIAVAALMCTSLGTGFIPVAESMTAIVAVAENTDAYNGRIQRTFRSSMRKQSGSLITG